MRKVGHKTTDIREDFKNEKMRSIKIILCALLFSVFVENAQAEKYIIKEVAFIPWGEDDSLLGFIPSGVDTNELGETIWVEPGEAVSSWDIDLKGNIYVADGVKANILIYDVNGKYYRSIGRWQEKEDGVEVKATSGQIREIKISHIGRPPEIPGIIYEDRNKNKYFEKVGDITVDGGGNIYALAEFRVEKDFKGETYTGSASGLMKFSPQGKLLEIIDQFGEYGSEEKKDICPLFSDAYGNIVIGMFLKSKDRLFMQFNRDGKLITVSEDMYYPLDSEGNYYILLTIREKWNARQSQIKIAIRDPEEMKEDTLTIHFGRLSSATFWRVDGDRNLYFNVGWAYHKYDQQGNLLAIIQGKHDTKRTLTEPITGMGKISKLMSNGDIYVAYMCDQGFVVVKQELQQETKGRILKPAVKPEE